MIDRTWKRVGHGREREGGGWEKANKKRRIGERYLPTWMECDQISF